MPQRKQNRTRTIVLSTLREVRLAAGRSIKWTAQQLGYTEPYISHLENHPEKAPARFISDYQRLFPSSGTGEALNLIAGIQAPIEISREMPYSLPPTTEIQAKIHYLTGRETILATAAHMLRKAGRFDKSFAEKSRIEITFNIFKNPLIFNRGFMDDLHRLGERGWSVTTVWQKPNLHNQQIYAHRLVKCLLGLIGLEQKNIFRISEQTDALNTSIDFIAIDGVGTMVLYVDEVTYEVENAYLFTGPNFATNNMDECDSKITSLFGAISSFTGHEAREVFRPRTSISANEWLDWERMLLESERISGSSILVKPFLSTLTYTAEDLKVDSQWWHRVVKRLREEGENNPEDIAQKISTTRLERRRVLEINLQRYETRHIVMESEVLMWVQTGRRNDTPGTTDDGYEVKKRRIESLKSFLKYPRFSLGILSAFDNPLLEKLKQRLEWFDEPQLSRQLEWQVRGKNTVLVEYQRATQKSSRRAVIIEEPIVVQHFKAFFDEKVWDLIPKQHRDPRQVETILDSWLQAIPKS